MMCTIVENNCITIVYRGCNHNCKQGWHQVPPPPLSSLLISCEEYSLSNVVILTPLDVGQNLSRAPLPPPTSTCITGHQPSIFCPLPPPPPPPLVLIMQSFVCCPLWTEFSQNRWYYKRTKFHWLCTWIFTNFYNFSWISFNSPVDF